MTAASPSPANSVANADTPALTPGCCSRGGYRPPVAILGAMPNPVQAAMHQAMAQLVEQAD